MKSIGIILIIAGVLALAYQGFNYKKQEKMAEVGDVKVVADTEKTIHIPPLVGGAVLVAGIALVFLGRNK